MEASTRNTVNGLTIGQVIRTANGVELPITRFDRDEKTGCDWAQLGKIDAQGYGERCWLITVPNDPFSWQKSKWQPI